LWQDVEPPVHRGFFSTSTNSSAGVLAATVSSAAAAFRHYQDSTMKSLCSSCISSRNSFYEPNTTQLLRPMDAQRQQHRHGSRATESPTATVV